MCQAATLCRQAFPSHREHAHLARLSQPAKFHIVLGDGSAGDGEPSVVTFRARSSKGANEGQLLSWLQPFEHEPVLWFEHLYHRFERFNKDSAVQAEARPRATRGVAAWPHEVAAHGTYGCMPRRDAPDLQGVITLGCSRLLHRVAASRTHVCRPSSTRGCAPGCAPRQSYGQ